jgi:ribosomal protein L35AE/L33A
METYIIKELQNLNSYREGQTVQAESLTAAKRKASKSRVYHGTVLVITDNNGIVLASQWEGKPWKDTSPADIERAYNLY